MRIAVLITCFNRKNKTLACIDALQETIRACSDKISLTVYLTDDGCTDGTSDAVRSKCYEIPINILNGTGDLFWNGGMINSWKAAIADGGFDGYLWMNDDTVVLPEFWQDLMGANDYSEKKFNKRGIYVGSTKDASTGEFTYGGFKYLNKLTLVDKFVVPDGVNFQECEAAHGNITYVSSEVVESQGIFCEKYWHGGTDHDYTFLAHKAGFPVLVLPHFSAICENDHIGKTRDFTKLPLIGRIKLFKSPKGYNMHNILLFNRRCFPWRVPFAWISGVVKMLFPRIGYGIYLTLRRVRNK